MEILRILDNTKRSHRPNTETQDTDGIALTETSKRQKKQKNNSINLILLLKMALSVFLFRLHFVGVIQFLRAHKSSKFDFYAENYATYS